MKKGDAMSKKGSYVTKYLGLLPMEMYRFFYGAASKYPFPRAHWDSKLPIDEYIEHLSVFIKEFNNDRGYFRQYLNGWNSQQSSEMMQNTLFYLALRQMVDYNKGLNRKKCKRSLRYRRLSRLSREMKKLMREHRDEDEKKPGYLKGYYLFTRLVRHHLRNCVRKR